MRTLGRILAAILGVAGVTGLLLCIAGVIGCWYGYVEAKQRIDHAFGRAEVALPDLEKSLKGVRDKLQETRGELSSIQKRQAEQASPAAEERNLQMRLTRQAVAKSSPQIGEARGKLIMATEAALVLNGFLDALGNVPLGEPIGISVDQLHNASGQLSDMIDQSEKLSALMAQLAPGATPSVAEQSAQITQLLDQVLAILDRVLNDMENAGSQLGAWHARVNNWLLWLVLAITAILIWIGLGQLSLLTHGFSWSIRGRQHKGSES